LPLLVARVLTDDPETPFLRITLHFSQTFLTLGRTFMIKPLSVTSFLGSDLSSTWIELSDLDRHAIARNDLHRRTSCRATERGP